MLNREKTDSGAMRRITRNIDPLPAMTIDQISSSCGDELLNKPIDYIVPAVWGARPGEAPDDTQRGIYTQDQQTVSTAADALEMEFLDPAQRFTIEFLVRELLISKLVLWKVLNQSASCPGNSLPPGGLEVTGNA